jgi:cytochrome c551/c552
LKGTRLIVFTGVGLLWLLNASSTALGERIALRVVPRFDPAEYAGRGAVGLMVPGVGGTVTRAGSLAALERGKVRHALLGGTPHGKVLVRPSAAPGSQVTIYVSLPPDGRTANHRRYPVAVVGCGFHGLLTSSATRVPGLISVADLAPAVVHLRRGGCDARPLGSTSAADAPARLRSLDRRIDKMHAARGWALVAVLVTVALLGLVSGTAGALGCTAAVGASLLLSALGVESFWWLVLGVAGLTAALALAVPLRRTVPFLVASFLVLLLLVLALDTQLNSLAVLGARPDGGGRFYGITNQLETLLLAPVLAAAAVAGLRWLVPLGLLTLVTVGWSKAGADGGGLVVYAAALAVLALHLRAVPLTARRLALAGIGVVALTCALVGIDAALGGSSHVTQAVGTGPGSLLDDLGRRLHLSYLSVTSSWGKGLEFGVAVAVLLAIAAFLRRGPTVDAMLAGLAVSFLVNDTPVDVAFLGALGCWTLVRWESVDSRPMRRPAAVLASLLLVLVLSGCGSEGVVRPAPQQVVGTVKQEAAGKGIFVAQGCNACHTYKPAAATGTIGPDLDKLAQYATQAKQPLDKFVQTSIVDPNVYVQKGYPKGVMPTTYKSLPAADLKALVDFLTKPSGG